MAMLTFDDGVEERRMKRKRERKGVSFAMV